MQTLLPLLHLQQLRRKVATAVLLLAWRHLYRQLLAMPGGQEIANRLCSYVAAVSNDDPRHLRTAYARISKESEEQYMTVAEKLREEGLQVGRQEGLHMALRKLFEGRFGPAPPAVVQLIENSSPAEFDHLMHRILAAKTPDDLLT